MSASKKPLRTSFIAWIKSWPHNSRFYIVVFNMVASLLIWQTIVQVIETPVLQSIRTEQWFGFLAFGYLYIALLATPLTKVFVRLPFEKVYMHNRRAFIVVALYYASLHSSVNFFGQLGGISGLQFLTQRFITALLLGLSVLLILFITALTSFDRAITVIGQTRWLWLQRLTYGAGIVVLVHIAIVGTHFSDLSATIPKLFFGATAFLLILEVMRLDSKLHATLPSLGRIGAATMVLVHAALFGFGYTWASFGPAQGGQVSSGLSVHAQHIKVAEANQAVTANTNTNTAVAGDSTLRYTVSFDHAAVVPGEATNLRFSVYNASSGNPVDTFKILYEKSAHLVIVNDALTYYDHIHPDYDAETNSLRVSAVFPKEDRYHLYLNYEPLGAIEQQVGFSLAVGTPPASVPVTTAVDTAKTKQVGEYMVSLASTTYEASKLSRGEQNMTFTLKDAQALPVKNLRPYLAAFGHMVMINEATYDYIHVHPTNTSAPQPNDTSGPEVDFMPLGLYGAIKPGTYRVFTQFNPNDQLLLTEFTIEVK